MTASIENIVQHLFHQPSLQTVSVDELQQMTQEHPSFAAARFLLLKKMQETGHPDFTSQLHKTTVYFNNPLWLQLLLSPMNESAGAWRPANATEMIEHDFDFPADLSGEASPQAETPEPADQPVARRAAEILTIKQINEPLIQEVLDRLRGQINDAGALPSSNKDIQSQDPLVREVLNRLRNQIRDAGDLPAIDKTAYSEDPLVQEVLDRLRQQISDAGDLPPIDRTTRIEDPLVQEVLDRLRAQIHQADAQQMTEAETPVSSAETFTPTEAPAQANSPVPDFMPAEIAAPENQPRDEDFAPVADAEPASSAAPIVVDATREVTHDAQVPAPGPVSPEPAIPARSDSPKIIIETPMAQHDVLFEPYHTIDYFASQGIRLDKLEPNPKDRLGRQLKSFTEWLKSMKKLPQASIEKALAENEESAVVAAASHSVEGKDVITEAMAEVFEKQGLHDKAIEVYRKLSLLNPAKSAYFADRINVLKHP